MTKTIYSNDQKYLVSRLRKARLSAGLSQSEVATRLKKTQSFISKIESGQQRVEALLLKEFANLYKKPITYFIRK